ncbi:unnamed protein product [Cyprideis torosa]|uniref:Aldehyde dehydrogenase domain-containing protein n=1 Tax=Cyprideis torosa TaxID=163714 RepID=A0A7R8WAF0_9CRUS|nr:unnamed protein product [Cyprideis torosa]CAG0890959.1 unnamed protein product [Cyprideis torosa]
MTEVRFLVLTGTGVDKGDEWSGEGQPSTVCPRERLDSSALETLLLLSRKMELRFMTCYVVIEGGVEETTQLLRERFDYIFYTGGSRVGRIVREASNRFLTPVTLELGGKSPLYLDGNVDWDTAVRRILWGKFCCNLGQACIAPDYILCNEAAQEEFIKRAAPILRDWFGSEPQKSNALARLINDRQFSDQ